MGADDAAAGVPAGDRSAPPVLSGTPDRAALRREVLRASIGILVVLGVLKHLGALVPPIAEYAFAAAAVAQLYGPLWIADRTGLDRDALGLDTRRWPRDVALALALGVATIVPFAIGHHWWQTELFHRTFRLQLADGLLVMVLTQVIAVALPEELFFRGYLLGRMEALWPARRRLFGAPFGAALLWSSVVFALAHFVGEYAPARLGPFFPALLFGLLRLRTGSIVAAVTYHAFCNVLSAMLWACYH